MTYSRQSIEGGLLAGNPDSVGEVSRWIARALTASRFSRLRHLRVDLHQEVLFRVVESLRRERFDSNQDFRLYVEAITRYTAARDMRRLARETSEEAMQNRLPATTGQPDAVNRLLVGQALSRLSNDCRTLLSRYFLEERSYEDIGTESGMPLGTVKSRLSRCLAAARRALRQHRGIPSENAGTADRSTARRSIT